MELKCGEDLLKIPEDEILFAGMSMWGALLDPMTISAHAEIIKSSRAKTKIIYLGDGLLRYTLAFSRIVELFKTKPTENFTKELSEIFDLNGSYYLRAIEERTAAWFQTNESKYLYDTTSIVSHSDIMKCNSYKENFVACVSLYLNTTNEKFRRDVNHFIVSFLERNLPDYSLSDELPDSEIFLDNTNPLLECSLSFLRDQKGNEGYLTIKKYSKLFKKENSRKSVFKILVMFCFGYLLEELSGFHTAMNLLPSVKNIHFIYPGHLSVVGTYFSFLLGQKKVRYVVRLRNIKDLMNSTDVMQARHRVEMTLLEPVTLRVKRLQAENEVLLRGVDQLIALKKDLEFENTKLRWELREHLRLCDSVVNGPDFDEVSHYNSSLSDDEVGETELPETEKNDDEINYEDKTCSILEGHVSGKNSQSTNGEGFFNNKKRMLENSEETIPVLFKVILSGFGHVGGCKLMSIIQGARCGDPNKPTIGVDFKSTLLTNDIKLQWWYTAEGPQWLRVISPYLRTCRNNIFHFDLSDEWAAERSRWICESRVGYCADNDLPCFMIGVLSSDRINISAFNIFEVFREQFHIEEVLYCGILPEQVEMLKKMIKSSRQSENVTVKAVEKITSEERAAWEKSQITLFLEHIYRITTADPEAGCIRGCN